MMWQENIFEPEFVCLIVGFILISFSLLVAAKFQGIMEIKLIEENNYFVRKTSFYLGLVCIALGLTLLLFPGNASISVSTPGSGENINSGGTTETQPVNGGNGDPETPLIDREPKPPPEIESSTQLVGWEYFQESGSQVKDFSQDNRGFSLIATSLGKSDPQYKSIQVISISSTDLSNSGNYKLKFSIQSDRSFVLTVRIGQKTAPYVSALNEGKTFVSGDGIYENKEIPFQVTDISNAFLHFQLGDVPPGSRISFRDIHLVQLSG